MQLFVAFGQIRGAFHSNHPAALAGQLRKRPRDGIKQNF